MTDYQGRVARQKPIWLACRRKAEQRTCAWREGAGDSWLARPLRPPQWHSCPAPPRASASLFNKHNAALNNERARCKSGNLTRKRVMKASATHDLPAIDPPHSNSLMGLGGDARSSILSPTRRISIHKICSWMARRWGYMQRDACGWQAWPRTPMMEKVQQPPATGTRRR